MTGHRQATPAAAALFALALVPSTYLSLAQRHTVHLHMFAQRARMGVGLVAPGNPTVVRFIRRVDMAVLLAIAAVREPPLAA